MCKFAGYPLGISQFAKKLTILHRQIIEPVIFQRAVWKTWKTVHRQRSSSPLASLSSKALPWILRICRMSTDWCWSPFVQLWTGKVQPAPQALCFLSGDGALLSAPRLSSQPGLILSLLRSWWQRLTKDWLGGWHSNQKPHPRHWRPSQGRHSYSSGSPRCWREFRLLSWSPLLVTHFNVAMLDY